MTAAISRPRAFSRIRITGRPTGRRSSYFLMLFGAVVVLSLLGLVMVLSASAANALRFNGSSWYYFRQQLAWLGLGSFAMVVAMRIDYQFWRHLTKPLMITALVLLVLVLTTHGITANGSTRWFGWGPVRLQPSEFAKLALVVHCSDLLAKRRYWQHKYKIGPVVISFAVIATLLMLQPNLGTTIICASIVLALLWAAGAPLQAFGAVSGVAALFATIFAIFEPYRMRRLVAFTDVWSNSSDSGYQTVQSLIAVSNGGITGVGLGASRGKWGYLPFAHTDFIFSIIAEELGLIGSLTVILLFLLIGVLGFAAASHAPDDFGAFVAIGITSWLLVQAFINIGVTLGLIPVTGVPLPFLSFGGSSLVVTMGAFGILLNIARQAR
jgi:cell division protein FtsW